MERTSRELEEALPAGRITRLRSGETIEISRRFAQELRERVGWQGACGLDNFRVAIRTIAVPAR